jgi:hypothetical protein
MNGNDGRDNTIVSLTGYMDNVQFGPVNEVTAYWEALRCGRQVPLRSEVDPRGIERALEYAFVIERIAPQIARFRLAGMHLNDLLGMEVRGMPITAMFTVAGRTEVATAMERVFQDPAVVSMRLRAESGIGKPPLDARLLLLPLRSDLGDITRALGCFVARGQIGRAPRRFNVSDAEILAIEAGKPLRQFARVEPEAAAHVVGLAEDPRQFQPAPIRQRPHLRLVKSD